MTFKELQRCYLEELKDHYDKDEILSIFYLLLDHHADMTRADFVINSLNEADLKTIENMQSGLSELKSWKPVQYITNSVLFNGCKINVTPEVLIPRRETEELAATVIREITGTFHNRRDLCILDIGTGSGCIAISLKKSFPEAMVFGMDISERALAVASKNAVLCNTPVHFFKGDILNHPSIPLPRQDFDLIVSNPPYIPKNKMVEMKRNVLDHEPGLALFVDESNPLIFYQAIQQFSNLYLKPGGSIYLEVMGEMSSPVAAIFRGTVYNEVEVMYDMQGKDRFIRVIKNS